MGTPRAESILNAFMSFDDAGSDDEGPPLDFDDAMAALEAQGAMGEASIMAPPLDFDEAMAALEAKCKVDRAAAPEDECDCSGSTGCSSNSVAGRDDGSSETGCIDDNEGDMDDDSDSSYEDDFESDSASESEEDEVAVAGNASPPTDVSSTGQSSSQVPGAGGQLVDLRGARARSGSRVRRPRDPSLGAVRADPSSGVVHRKRDVSIGALLGYPSGDAGQHKRNSSRGASRRDPSVGAVQRKRSSSRGAGTGRGRRNGLPLASHLLSAPLPLEPRLTAAKHQ